VDERSQGTRQRSDALVVLLAAVMLGGSVTAPVRAAPPVAGGGKLKAAQPVGAVRFIVPRRSPAITSFRVWLDADLSAFSNVQIEVSNVSAPNSRTFHFAIDNADDGKVGSDDVSIVLDSAGKVHHLLSFRLNSDYIPAQGCSTSWPEGVRQEIWSVRVSGVPNGGSERRGVPLQRVRVRSYDFGNPCPSHVPEHVWHCIDPDDSAVVRPSFGEILACAATTLAIESTS
jgi:hypothetical protein